MFSRMRDYFLGAYAEADYISIQRARVFFTICTAMVVVTVSLIISFLVRGLCGLEIIVPASIVVIASIACIIFLRRGNLIVVPHIVLIIYLLSIWYVLFFDTADTVRRLDTIVMIFGVLFLTPLAVTKRKILIIFYFLANATVLIVFSFVVKKELGIQDYIIVDFIIDNSVTMVFVGTVSYMIFSIYTNALQQARESELTIQNQYDEIQGQNEELKAANEEFEVINEELAETNEELNRAHERLSQEKELLSTTLRSIEDAVVTTDLEGKIVLMNRSAERIAGCMAGEAHDRSFDEVIDLRKAATDEACRNPALSVVSEGCAIDCLQDLVLLKNDGTRRDIILTGAPIHDAHNKVVGVVIVMRDITDSKKIEEELRKASKIETLGVFAGGIAHDFNNLITSVIGNISIAKHLLKNDERVLEIIIAAEEASLKTKDLAHQLLTFTKGGEPLKETATVKDILEDTAKFVLSGSQIECSYSFPDDLWNAIIDKGQISQVIHNIVLNARQAMSDSGRINISAENAIVRPDDGLPLNSGNYLKITIADEGPGISDEYRDRVFDPFFTTKKEGSGLGLAISFSIIKKHEGHINISATGGMGTAFEIYIPATAEEVMQVGDDEDSKLSASGRILLLDDDENILNVMKNMLAYLGFEVTTALTGEEAIDLYRQAKDSGNGYDCVIMDLTIRGGMGGEKALQILMEYDNNILAVVSSGYANDPIIANYRDFGFSGAIRKPFRLEELKAVLGAVMSQE